MCTSASPSELVLIWSILLGPLAALPIGTSIAAWRIERHGWRIAAALAALLPLAFVLRGGVAALVDAGTLVAVVLCACGVALWFAALKLPRVAPLAAALVALGVLVLVGDVAYASANGPTCAEIMAPPTPTV